MFGAFPIDKSSKTFKSMQLICLSSKASVLEIVVKSVVQEKFALIESFYVIPFRFIHIGSL